MAAKQLQQLSKDELIEKVLKYQAGLKSQLRQTFIALLLIIVGVFFSCFFSPVSFNLISSKNFTSLNSHILWSGALIIAVRAIVLIICIWAAVKLLQDRE